MAGEALELLTELRSEHRRKYLSNPNDQEAVMFSILADADAFWWSSEICQVMALAANSIPKWTLRTELFPTIAGFFWFQRPILNLQGFAYRVITGDEAIQFDKPSVADSVHLAFWDNSTQMVWSQNIVPAGTTIPDGLNHTKQDWGEVPTSADTAARIAGACLLFLEQRIAIHERVQPLRAVRKRLEKKGEFNYPNLRLVYLRRPRGSGDSINSEAVNWTHRWMVRGHWRQQFFASDGSHRPKWIAPYIKGPEDKPLKAPDREVFAVVR